MARTGQAATRRAGPTSAGPAAGRRVPLSRDQVLKAAVTLADEGGIDALSMRKLGQALGVEAMSLYNLSLIHI